MWYAKYRLPDGRQVQRRVGPAWSERGRPAAGYFTKRTAQDWLGDVLDQARRGTLPGMVRTGATFADACAEYLRSIEHDRARKPSTVRDYHSIIKAHLLPTFGSIRLEDLSTERIERWAEGLTLGGRMNNRTKLKILTVLHGVMQRAKRVWKLPVNPVAGVEKPTQRHRTEIDVFSADEVWALVRAAASEQDAGIFQHQSPQTSLIGAPHPVRGPRRPRAARRRRATMRGPRPHPLAHLPPGAQTRRSHDDALENAARRRPGTQLHATLRGPGIPHQAAPRR